MTQVLTQEPLFRNAYEALCFAYQNSSNSTDRPAMSKMADKSRHDGKGLGGLDGSAQAGMIRAAIQRDLSRLHEAIVIAKFAPPDLPCTCGRLCCSEHQLNLEWMAAIRIISDAAVLEALTGHLTVRYLRDTIVGRYFGRNVITLADAAKKAGVHANTVSDHNGKVRLWLKGDKVMADGKGRKGEEPRAIEEGLNALAHWFNA